MQYFEDIEVGTKSSFGHYEVTREEVIAFASKYDPQPFHLSDEAAAATHFGRLSASGWHTCAMTMSMVVENFKASRQAGLGSPGIDELRWTAPVRPGDTLHGRVTVDEVRESSKDPKRGTVLTTSEVFNQDDVLVMRIRARGFFARR